MGRLGLRGLAAFVLTISSAFADEPVSIEDWARHVVDNATPTNVSDIRSPEAVLELIKEYSGIQNEKFNAALKEQFFLAVQNNYRGSIEFEKFSETLKQALRRIQEKEHRFSKEDPVKILRIGLKIACRYEMSNQEWDLFKEHFFRRFNPPTEIQTAEARIEAFWTAVSLASRDFYSSRSNTSDAQVDAASRKLFERVQRLNSVLSKHTTKDSLFLLSLEVAQLLDYEENSSKEWTKLRHSVAEEFGRLAKAETKKFLLEADTGKLRQKLGDWNSIRFDVIIENGDYHLVTIAQKNATSPSIVVINPPHSLEDGQLSPNSHGLRKLVWNLHQDTIIFDFDNVGLKPLDVYKHEEWWNPKRYITDIRGAYEHPTTGSVGLGVASVVINGGTRAKLLATAAAASAVATGAGHNAVHFHWGAVGIFAGYMFFCASWNKFYDNVMSLFPGTMSETAMKIITALPVTYAFLELTTSPKPFDHLNLGIPFTELTTRVNLPMEVPGIAATLVLTIAATSVDKLVSTYVRRIIRFLVKEGVIHGEYNIKTGHLNPIRWLQWIKKENSKAEGFQETKIIPTAEEMEISESDLSFEDAENLINARKAHLEKTRLDKAESKSPQNERSVFGGKVALAAEKGVVVRELQGYGHNWVNSITQTLSPTLGFSILTTAGLGSNYFTLRYAKKKLEQYRAEKNEAMVEFYEKEIRKIERDFLIVPGLFPQVKKVAQFCRGLITSLGKYRTPG